MSTQDNVQIVKDFFAAIGRGDKQALRAICADDVEWIIPGVDWPLAGTHRGHAGVLEVLEKSSEMEISSPAAPEFVAQGERVMMTGFAEGKVNATNGTFEDDFVFAFTVRQGKVTHIREYVDTQALARAAQARPAS